MSHISKGLLSLTSLLLLIGCQGNNTSSTSQTLTVDENEETITRAAANVDDLTIQVHDNTFATTSSMYESVDSMSEDFTRMSESVTERMTQEMKLLNTLAKPFSIDENYSAYFAVDNNYTATTPAFVILQTLPSQYFLVSSPTKFYTDGSTVKTLFNDATTLTNAWSRAITSADKNKDLFLSLLELDANATVKKITNSFLIKSATLQSF